MLAASDFGLWREHACVPEQNLWKMPDDMSHEEGAALLVNYLTAYLMLFDMGNLRRGKSVLVHMAGDGYSRVTDSLDLSFSIHSLTLFCSNLNSD